MSGTKSFVGFSRNPVSALFTKSSRRSASFMKIGFSKSYFTSGSTQKLAVFCFLFRPIRINFGTGYVLQNFEQLRNFVKIYAVKSPLYRRMQQNFYPLFPHLFCDLGERDMHKCCRTFTVLRRPAQGRPHVSDSL